MKNEYLDCAYYDNNIYYFVDVLGVPIKHDIKEMKLELLTSIEGLKKIGRGTYALTTVHDDCLFGLEQSAERVAMVDLKTREASVYQICESEYKTGGNIATVFFHENSIFCFMKRDCAALVFNCDTKSVKELSYLEKTDWVFNCGIRIGDIVYLAAKDDCVIVKYSLSTGNSEVIQLKESFKTPVDIKKIGDDLFVLESSGKLTRVSTGGEIKREYFAWEDNCEVSRFYLTNDESKAVILPGLGKDIFIMDIISGGSKKFSDYPDDFGFREGGMRAKYLGGTESVSHVYYGNRLANYTIRIDKTTGEISWSKSLSVPGEIEMAYEYSTKNLMTENSEKHLMNFLDMLAYS